MSDRLPPFLLQPRFSPRPWGRRGLLPWYSAEQTGATSELSEPVGEAWLTGAQCVVAEGALAGQTLQQVSEANGEALLGEWSEEREFPLLLKLLFPDQKLSVQVHPDDAQARAMGQPRGKTECWYVVDAEPGATVACGLRLGVKPEQMRAAAGDGAVEGAMESLLQFVPVSTGDMVFVDAGTVHAIGPGVTLLETQQTSDTTFRLFDYGRPRELHLQQGIAVSRGTTRAGKVKPVEVPGGLRLGGLRLIKEQYFTVDRFVLKAGESLPLGDAVGRPHCFTTLEGGGRVKSGREKTSLKKAHATVVPASAGEVVLEAEMDLVVVRSMP